MEAGIHAEVYPYLYSLDILDVGWPVTNDEANQDRSGKNGLFDRWRATIEEWQGLRQKVPLDIWDLRRDF